MPDQRPCRADPDRWFAETPDPACKSLCMTSCMVTKRCGVKGRLEPYGIWGGLDVEERRIKRRREQRVTYAARKAAANAERDLKTST